MCLLSSTTLWGGREQVNRLDMMDVRINELQNKLDELIHQVNWIAQYYKSEDFAGNIKDLNGEVKMV